MVGATEGRRRPPRCFFERNTINTIDATPAAASRATNANVLKDESIGLLLRLNGTGVMPIDAFAAESRARVRHGVVGRVPFRPDGQRHQPGGQPLAEFADHFTL